MNSSSKKPKAQPNNLIRWERESQNWTLQDVADKLYDLCVKEDRESGISADTVGRWERGVSRPEAHYRAKLCELFRKNPVELGFVDEQADASNLQEKSPQIITVVDSGFKQFTYELSLTDKLDSAESIIDLAWEAWFASRPREVARTVNKLLPGLEKIAYSPYPLGNTLRAKKLALRAHGLLGSVCLDASQNDTALFHYMQAHRFAEEIHDVDLAATYLCLLGEVLRQQKDQTAALSHMQQAKELASHASNTTQGHILQLLAYTYGDTGQEIAFEGAISEATDLLAFSGEGIDTVQREFIPFEVYEIRGKIYRDLGKPTNAIPYLDLAEKSLNAASSVTPRWQALLEISRAQTYCDAGDIDLGIKLACKGFIMAYQCHSVHQMNRVRKLLRKLESSPFKNHPGVQELKNLLSEIYMKLE